jgi:hypothetical protein
MSSVRGGIVAAVEAWLPRGELFRLRIRVSLEQLVTLGMTALAIALAIAYQVLSRIGPSRGAGPR